MEGLSGRKYAKNQHKNSRRKKLNFISNFIKNDEKNHLVSKKNFWSKLKLWAK
jgi:hypothetical protein